MGTLQAFIVRLALVVAFTWASSAGYYQQFVVTPVEQFPTWWQSFLAGSNSGAPNASPVSILDAVSASTYAAETAVLNQLSWHDIGGHIALLFIRALIVGSLAVAFLVKAGLAVLAMTILIVGPVMILFALFPATVYLLTGWVAVLITLLLQMFAVDTLLGIWGAIIQDMMGALTSTEASLWGAVVVTFVFGGTAGMIPFTYARIAGGVGIATDRLAVWMSGAVIAQTAGAAATPAAAAVAGPAGVAAVTGFTRIAAPVARSLSL